MKKADRQELLDIYAAADRWVDAALRADDSLFTPGEPIWSTRWLTDLRERFIENPDESDDPFEVKLARQLVGAPPETIQLMGEVLYIHLLVAWKGSIGEDRKRALINTVLGWLRTPVSMPPDLDRALRDGLAATGIAFMTFRPFQVAIVVRFVELWKSLADAERQEALADPWAFKALVQRIEARGAWAQREALLHFVHPDTFEAIISRDQKDRISSTFANLIPDSIVDIDKRLLAIRETLSTQYGAGFSFYEPEIQKQWQRDTSLWGQFVSWARKFYEQDDFDEVEITHKLESARLVRVAMESLEGSPADATAALKKALRHGYLLNFRVSDSYLKWVEANPEQAIEGLQAIWGEEKTTSERIQGWSASLPADVIGGAGSRLSLASVLLMGLDPHLHPPFRADPFNHARKLTGHPSPPIGDEADLYAHFLGFLQKLSDECTARGLNLRDLLDAQSVMWATIRDKLSNPNEQAQLERWRKGEVNTEDDGTATASNGPSAPTTARTLAELAGELLLDEASLQKAIDIVRDKGQAIFNGPPGTGKTFIAQALAEWLSGGGDGVELVQFHPSYAYEDFVEGYRPRITGEGQSGFSLKDGPLKRIAQRAAENPERTYVLIIDEINRGNVAKVFGELYFLLEYRRRDVSLQYSEEPFSLPQNLLLIGTMNTADRSIALVDAALRRRFHFLPFFPDEPPIEGLLRKWLTRHKPDMMWVADVVDRANELLHDRHRAVGPSHFLRADLSESWVELIWGHSVMPYLAEIFFGNEDRLPDFELAALRALQPGSGGTEQLSE